MFENTWNIISMQQHNAKDVGVTFIILHLNHFL